MAKTTRTFEEKRQIAQRLIVDLNKGLTVQHAARREGIPYTSLIEILRRYVIIRFEERYPASKEPQLELDFTTPPSWRTDVRVNPPRYLFTPTKK